jgi:D-serine deaminase-like pyridoxal phosphate-dependent protein
MRKILADIERPTLVLDEVRARRNIGRMAEKARRSGVRFRPHFKTHQSAVVGDWFRDFGVDAITVSSVDMAVYFADHGWNDITIAFPVNVRQLGTIHSLAHRISLGILVESEEIIPLLCNNLTDELDVWLKVDVGYRRTGIDWEDVEGLIELGKAVSEARGLTLRGLLTHAGNTYGAGSPGKIIEVYLQSVERMNMARDALGAAGLETEVSVGDTPGCSLVDRFEWVDEVRPGNFVFYDLMQYRFGSCSENDIAMAVACPIVALHPERGQLTLYGGAVHLSNATIPRAKGGLSFGAVALPSREGWSSIVNGSELISLSQEHGIVQASGALFEGRRVGDIVVVIPVHSCLTANLIGSYITLGGDRIEMFSYAA